MDWTFATLARFCFAWVTVYVMLGFVYSLWTLAAHFNGVVNSGLRFGLRSHRARGSWYAAVASAVRQMARGSAIAFPVGVLSLLASAFFS